MIEAWHFVGKTLRDGRPVPADGEVLRHDGPLVLCESGLHASIRIIDALQFAPGHTICRVRCGGSIEHDSDKLICTERTILWRIDGERVLRDFARQQARSVLHLWDAPEVVREYLTTGDENLRDAARAAAGAARAAADAVGVAADAARDAAWDAADAARASADAAWNAAWAATDAARAVAWAAAWAAARDAANAAWDAAWAAAWAAARDAANAAWDAAWAAANSTLERMVIAAHEAVS